MANKIWTSFEELLVTSKDESQKTKSKDKFKMLVQTKTGELKTLNSTQLPTNPSIPKTEKP